MPNALQIADPNADNPLAQAPSWADAYGSVSGTVSGGMDALGQWLAAQRAKNTGGGGGGVGMPSLDELLAYRQPQPRPPVWPMSNPVGTDTTQSMQSATPINPLMGFRSDGSPITGTDLAAVRQGMAWVKQAAPTMVLGMMGTTAPGIRAFHGSPYDFERFDTSRIGTGEGAQAYGHGLYFAEGEGTARSYRDALTQKDFKTSTGEAVPDWIGNSVKQVGDQFGTDSRLYQETIDRHIADFQGRKAETEKGMDTDPQPWMAKDRIAGFDNIIDGLNKLKSGDATLLPRGRMYEVNLKASPEDFLHQDKRMSDQSEQVQNAIRPLMQQNPTLKEVWQGNPYGSEVYEHLARETGSAGTDYAAASQTLQNAGVPGIRYLDQGSRGAGSGTHNYVVFDANTIDILRKYGLAGLGVGLSGAAAGTQGQPQQ